MKDPNYCCVIAYLNYKLCLVEMNSESFGHGEHLQHVPANCSFAVEEFNDTEY